MIDPIKLAQRWRSLVVKDDKFAFDNNPSRSLELPPESLIHDYFRQWQPIKEKRNLAFDENGARDKNFDVYKDSWFDYPTIIQHKMGGKSWKDYNCLVAIHVPACTYSCWHCYVGDDAKNPRKMLTNGLITYATPSELVDAFLDQKKANESESGGKIAIPTNVIRVTGGEPFLEPDLILGILNDLKRRGISKEIFVWTETNLSPFIREASGEPLIKSWVNLDELASFNNLAIHPCLHGIDPSSYQSITGCDPYYFEGILDGLKTLIDYKFDIYPTFGSNVSPPHKIPYIFKRLKEIHKNLPRRFALIDYELHYPPTRKRILGSLEPEQIYNKVLVIGEWSKLLSSEYGEEYPGRPRHLVPV
jgi:uncharacterized Fe-S cluster-containing radical SAM superfamily protein